MIAVVVEVDTTMMMMRIVVKPSEFLSSQVFNDCVSTIITAVIAGSIIIEVGAVLLPRRSVMSDMIVGAARKELMTAVWKWLTWQETRGALAFGGST